MDLLTRDAAAVAASGRWYVILIREPDGSATVHSAYPDRERAASAWEAIRGEIVTPDTEYTNDDVWVHEVVATFAPSRY